MRTDLGKVFVSLSVLVTGLAWTASEARAQGPGGLPPGVVELHRDVSPPLRDIEPEVPNRGPAHAIPLQHPAPGTGPGGLYADPALQTTLGPSVTTDSGLGFDGVGTGFTGPQGTYTVGVAPPDTNGAVGATQYVQWVNLSFAVFDKSTGAVLKGPMAGNTIWSGFGGACQNTNDGDVIAQYDKLANRWVMAQLSYSQAPPYLLCLAVSETSDATGAYYRYSFSYSGNLNDYPKVGVWPDGYYVTANMFQPILVGSRVVGYNYVGPEVCAFDHNSMLSGGASNPICQTLSSSYSSLLPADLDGTNPPPAGSPNYLLALGGNSSLYLWKFKPNFSNGTSTLTGPTTLSVASYNQACGGGTCIPQLGTSQQLDSLGDRLMYRLAYRNLNGTETLLANHSVATTVGGSSTVGVRWYEIRNPNGTPSVNQQSTWAPDATYRWMGSLAMDKVGNIALGYSTSSSSANPGIWYTGRLSTDALNTMQSENNIISGTGSQLSGLERWGDYSSMSVDPVDDCTFWYTTEYLKANGTFNWSTRIASFSFPSCTGAASTPDFSLAGSPASQSVTQGTTAQYTITVSSLNSFNNAVALSVPSACVTGATCSISPSSVTPPANGTTTATLSVTTTASTPAGTYSGITVTGTSGSLTHTTSVSLTVNAPAAADFSISASPGNLTLKKNQSGSYTVTSTPSGGFNSNVTVSANCPSGFTCQFTNGGIIAAGSGSVGYAVKNLSAPRNSNYTITFYAIGGTKTHTTNVGLKSR